MTSSSLGSSDYFFYSKEEIVDYLLQNILGNTKKLAGTEWELFFLNEADGSPISRDDGQKAFELFAQEFSSNGYYIKYQKERIPDGSEKITGLDVKGFGSIQLEAGHQFEFAGIPSDNPQDINARNREAFDVIVQVARKLNHQAVFTGYRKGYAEKSQGVHRSRGMQWNHYYHERFGNDPENAVAFSALREAQNGTASIQVTLDAGADKFHEYYQVLLLVEPILTLAHTNSMRPGVSVQAYGKFIPTQVEPITAVWGTKNPREALEIIVDRLLQLEVPFLPNPAVPGTYIAEALDADKRPPTVQDIMYQGRLSELNLNGAASFFYTRPALRQVMMGLLEVRGMDSPNNPRIVETILREVTTLVYNDDIRTKLLQDYAHLKSEDIAELHKAATLPAREAQNTIVAGKPVLEYMRDILGRVNSNTPVPTAAELLIDRRKNGNAALITAPAAPSTVPGFSAFAQPSGVHV